MVVQKYVDRLDEETNEIFVPDYQRELVWSDSHQSKFIESLLIGLPIPYIFVADVKDDDNPDLSGRLEIVDGTQRIRTLARYLGNELRLKDLKKVDKANGTTFTDLTAPRQRRFRRITIRMIELTENTSEETRRDMFERINTGTVDLKPMEKRRGSFPGPFIDLVSELAKHPLFETLAPMSDANVKRFERDELVSRFFAFQDYAKFGQTESGKRVSEFVENYTTQLNTKLEGDAGELKAEMTQKWVSMLEFVATIFPNGFKKSAKSKSTPRVRFEAIAVGSSLALAQKTDLPKKPVDEWLASEKFRELTTSDAANNSKRVVDRIEYVRDQLLSI